MMPASAPPGFKPLMGGNLVTSNLISAAQIAGITTRTIYTAESGTHQFSHQAKIIAFGGLLWVCWCRGPVNEGDLGTNIVYSTSADGGTTWTTPADVAPTNAALTIGFPLGLKPTPAKN